jgi:hypothetical protein
MLRILKFKMFKQFDTLGLSAIVPFAKSHARTDNFARNVTVLSNINGVTTDVA